MNCIVTSSKDFQNLLKQSGLSSFDLELKVSKWQEEHGLDSFPTVEDINKPNEVQYALKAVDILSSKKGKEIFDKGIKNDWSLDKILTELSIPKEQKQLILNLGKTNREEIITDLLANYSYTIEINTAKENHTDEGDDSTEHSSLTVPGGTNYKINVFKIPLIIPSIINHFFHKHQIGWFRSDDRLAEDTKTDNIDGTITDYTGYNVNKIPSGYTIYNKNRGWLRDATGKPLDFKTEKEASDYLNKLINQGITNNSSIITKNDKIIFGHPTIGKSYLKQKGNNDFITLDDDYADEVNAFIDANRGSETRQEYKGRKPKEYNEFMLNLFDRLKVQAKKEGKRLFVSNTNILKERMSEFDKVITIPKDEFKKRFDARGATYGFEDWKSDIDTTIAKVDKSKVISTTGYLSDLLEGNTKTRRILEVQSDLFQKGRGKENLVQKISGTDEDEESYGTFYSNGFLYREGTTFNEHGKYFKNNNEISSQEYSNAYENSKKEIKGDNKQNQFLQLLNKDNNWVTFFIKSIIQDSAKKGYEKVLFPTGNTASKVEGHTTLEEFKKQKEDRLKQLENIKSDRKALISQFENGKKTREEVEGKDGYFINVEKPNGGSWSVYVENKIEEDIAIQEELSNLNFSYNEPDIEINQLKQELERVETEGFGALKPIYNFYENTVTNILNKTYGDTKKSTIETYNLVYHALFVNKVDKLKEKYKPVHPNEFYHHSTIEFKPKNADNIELTKQSNIKVLGRLTTDKVDVLLVENPKSKNKFSHITLSTAEGIKPFASNSEIENNQSKIEWFKTSDNISVTEGFNDGVHDILSQIVPKVTDEYGNTWNEVELKQESLKPIILNKSKPEATNKVSTLPEIKTVKSGLQNIVLNESHSRETRLLAGKLLEWTEKNPVTINYTDTNEWNDPRIAASYDVRTGSITIYRDAKVINQKDLDSILIHELEHHLLYVSLRNKNPDAVTKEFQDTMFGIFNRYKDFVQNNEHLINKYYPGITKEEKDRLLYGLQDVHEFASEIMANARFAKFIDNVSRETGFKDVIKTILDFIFKLLGIHRNTGISNLIKEHINTFIENNHTQTGSVESFVKEFQKKSIETNSYNAKEEVNTFLKEHHIETSGSVKQDLKDIGDLFVYLNTRERLTKKAVGMMLDNLSDNSIYNVLIKKYGTKEELINRLSDENRDEMQGRHLDYLVKHFNLGDINRLLAYEIMFTDTPKFDMAPVDANNEHQRFILTQLDTIDKQIRKPDNAIEDKKNPLTKYEYQQKLLDRISERKDKAKKKQYPGLKDVAQIKSDDPKSVVGTIVHNDLERVASEVFGLELKNPREFKCTPDVIKSMRDYFEQFKAAHPVGTQFRVETSVVNLKEGYAGTIDIMAILPNGKVKVYDYKTHGFKPGETRMNTISEFANKVQLDLINKALQSDTYDIDKNDIETALLPLDVSFKVIGKDNTVVVDGFKIALPNTYDGTSTIYSHEDQGRLNPIAGNTNLTGDEKTDHLLEKLRDRVQGLRDAHIKNDDTKEWMEAMAERNKEIDNLNAAIDQIFYNRNFTKYLEAVDNEVNQFRREFNKHIDLDNISMEQLNYITNRIIVAYDATKFYRGTLIKDGTHDEIITKIRDNIEDLGRDLEKLRTNIINKLADMTGVDNIWKAQQHQTMLGLNMNMLSEIDNANFEVFHGLVIERKDALNTDVTNFFKKQTELTDKYLAWARSKGKTNNNAFDLITEKDGSLKPKFDWNKWKEDWAKAVENSDTQWLTDNMKVSDYQISKYKRYKERAILNLETRMDKNSTEYLQALDTIENQNPELLTSRYNLKSEYFHPSEEYYTDFYKNLSPEAKEYYEFDAEHTREAMYLLGGYGTKFYVPNDLTDDIFQHGVVQAFTNLAKGGLGEAWQYKPQGVESQGEIKRDINGNRLRQMPKRFIYGDDKVSYTNDRAKALAIAYYQAKRNQYFGEIEHLSTLLLDKISQDQEYIVNGLGQSADKSVKLEGSLKEAFRDFIDYYVYDIKNVSSMSPLTTKIFQKLNNYMSFVMVGTSFMSNTANLMATGIGTAIETAKGRNYDSKDMAWAVSQIRNVKTAALVDLMNINESEKHFKRATNQQTHGIKILGHNLKNHASMELFYKGFEIPENYAKLKVMLAFMHGNTIVNGRIVRLTPELKKTHQPLSEMFEYDEKTGDMTLPKKMDRAMFIRLRDRVQSLGADITGMSSADDIRRSQRELGWKSIMTFRGWLPRLYQQRFMGIKYRKVQDQIDMGRYNSIAKAFGVGGFEKTMNDYQHYKYTTDDKANHIQTLRHIAVGLAKFAASYIDWITFHKLNLDKTGITLTDRYQMAYAKFKEDRPEYSYITESEFVGMMEANMKGNFLELSVMLALYALYLGIKNVPDDEEQNNFAQLTLINRLMSEISFFWNPNSFQQIIRGNIVPMWGFLANIWRAVTGIKDYIELENSDLPNKDYYGNPLNSAGKIIPGANLFYSFEYLYNNKKYKATQFQKRAFDRDMEKLEEGKPINKRKPKNYDEE